MRWRRQRRVDREGRDVGLVDHQPHPAVGGDVVAGPRDEVVRQAVRLELAPVGVRRPRRGEARPLDGVDGRQVVDAASGSIASLHRGSRDHATSPRCSRARRAAASRSPGTSVSSVARRRRRASALGARARMSVAPEPVPGRLAPSRPSRGPGRRGRPRRASRRRRVRARCPPGRGRAGRRHGPRADRTGPAGSSEHGPPIGRAAVAARSASRGRDADERDAQAVGQALGGRDPDAQAGERTRARSRRRSRPSRDRADRPSPRSRSIDGRSVSPWR